MELWFAIDKRTAECGLVAASSALRQWNAVEPLSIVAAYEVGTPAPADFWPAKLRLLQKPFEFRQCPVDVSDFDTCKGVFDSRAAYIRLFIPQHTEQNFAVYSDSDVVFLSDPGEILSEFISSRVNNQTIGLVPLGQCSAQPAGEQELLSKSGKKPSHTYFYSGLAVFDTPSYRAAGVADSAASLARIDGGALTYHDQTLWNCVLKDDQVAKLNAKWVQPAWPGRGANATDFPEGILHFAGSPKPWDLLGEFFHPYYSRYRDAAQAAGYKSPALRKYLDPMSWERALRIKKQYKAWFRGTAARKMSPDTK